MKATDSSAPSVEREFIIIGEATAALARVASEVFEAITRARRIIDFRNQLTHEYPTVDDAIVWAIVEHDVPLLRRECASLFQRVIRKDEVVSPPCPADGASRHN